MTRPAVAHIHLPALRHNLQRVRQLAPHSKLWAVVKANAYGHGLEHVFPALCGADGFAVLGVNEGQSLRNLGWRAPILLVEGVFEARELELCSRLDLWPVVHTTQQIDWLATHKTDRTLRVFLKLNSGMNRLGFAPQAYRSAYARLSALPQVEDVVHMTHFANADCTAGHCANDVLAALQCFNSVTQDLAGERSLANSATLLCQGAGLSAAEYEALCADWTRPGIALYGASPDYPAHSAMHWGLQPAMSLRSRIISTQALQAGQAVGYGSSFVASSDMRVGTVALGYADGYPRHAGTGTPVLVDGQRSRVLGRVSMDMLCVDLSALPHASLGSEVTLWGCASTGEVLDIDEVAHAAGTIGYELMCALASRVAVMCEDEA